MTTPTTQREADERVRLPQPDTTYYAPFQGASLKYHSADQIIEYKDRCVAEALARQAAPEAPANEQQDRRALELANAALIAAQPRDITPKGWKRHIAAIDATNCALHKPVTTTVTRTAATDQPSAGSGQKSTEAES